MNLESGERNREGSCRLAASVAAAAFLLSVLFRLTTWGDVFRGDVPRVPPFDDQYQAMRIVYSARHFPKVFDFDPDRGVHGAWASLPPLYDLATGGAARLLGARSEPEVLRRAVFFPVAVAALLVALLSFVAVSRFGVVGGSASALALVFSLPLLAVSRLGSVDHHYVEPPLLLLVLATTIRAAESRSRAEALGSGLFLGLTLSLALFFQTALLLAAGLGFLALFVLCGREREPLLAGGLGFALAAAAVFGYRASRPAAVPDNEWYLGTPHAAALLAAALSLGALALLLGRGAGPLLSRGLALALGAASAAAVRGALPAFAEGARFFGGEGWFATVQEFQPLLFGSPTPLLGDLLFLGGGALLTVAFALAALASGFRRERVAALFAAGYLFAGIGSRRLIVPAAPLLAVVGGAVVADRWRAGKRRAGAATALVLAVPALLGGWRELRSPWPFEPAETPAFERAARFLAGRTEAPGRVLGPWTWGHLMHRLGGRGVLLDNFGAMLGRVPFEDGIAAPLTTREDLLASWCRSRNVRFVVLDNPLTRISRSAETLGLPPSVFLRPGAGKDDPLSVTRFAQATFWWRAYFDHGAALPPAGSRGAPFRFFRLVYSDPEPSPDPPPFRGPLVQVWELVSSSA